MDEGNASDEDKAKAYFQATESVFQHHREKERILYNTCPPAQFVLYMKTRYEFYRFQRPFFEPLQGVEREILPLTNIWPENNAAHFGRRSYTVPYEKTPEDEQSLFFLKTVSENRPSHCMVWERLQRHTQHSVQAMITKMQERGHDLPWLNCVTLRTLENIIDTLAFNIQCLRPVLKHIADRDCIAVIGCLLDCIDGNKRYTQNDVNVDSTQYLGFNSMKDVQNLLPFVKDVMIALNQCLTNIISMSQSDTVDEFVNKEQRILLLNEEVFLNSIERSAIWLKSAKMQKQRLHSVAAFGLVIDTGCVWDGQAQRQACFQWKSDVLEYLQQVHHFLSMQKVDVVKCLPYKIQQSSSVDLEELNSQMATAQMYICAIEFKFHNCCQNILNSCNFNFLPNSEELQAKLRSFCTLPDVPGTNPLVYYDVSVQLDTVDTSHALIQPHKLSHDYQGYEGSTCTQSQVLSFTSQKLDNILDLFSICKTLFSHGPDQYRKPTSY